jgi:type VI secretion system protein VasD
MGILAGLLAGCAAPPPPVPPTVVNVTLNTTADANPTPVGVGAPLALRVYQLASSANFNAAEFFPLYNDDAGTLKSDLARREDFLLAPGASKSETIMPLPTVASIAIFAAYRDFQHAVWRGAADIPAHQTTNITVTAGRDGLTVKAVTAPPPPKSGS